MTRIRINDWTLDAQRNLLMRGPESVRLEPKAADLLQVLHAHGGNVVGKEELIRAVWGDVAITDDVLTTAIYQLRRALGDDRVAPRYIETVRRRGYRLILQPDPPRTPRYGRPLAALLAATCAALIFIAMAEQRATRAAARELHSLGEITLHRGVELPSAVRMFERAAELDPDNAAIASSLAFALALEGSDLQAARTAARRALDLDPRSTDALVARSLVALWADWDWESATRDLRVAARGGDPIARSWLAYLAALTGDRPSVVAAVTGIAGPPIAASTAATALLLSGAIDDAERMAAAASHRDPDNTMLTRQLQKIRDRRLEKAGTPVPDPPGKVSRPTDIARLHLAHGNVDAALDSLEAAWRQRDTHLLYLRVDQRWDAIRTHPRFQSIIAGVGP